MSKLLLMLSCLAVLPAFGYASQAPLAVRNLSPVSQLYGLPAMRGGERCCAATRVSFAAAEVSNFTSANIDGAQLFFDGETTVVEYTVRRNWGGRGEWGITLPLVMHSGGFMDRFIDGFHDLFGLPEGGRERARRNQLDYLVRVDGETFASFRESQRGLGDLRGWLGYQLHQSADRALMVRGQLKAPTGRAKRLTGSEAFDLAVWMELEERALLSGLGTLLTLGAGGVWIGEGELVPRQQESLAMVAHLGLQRPVGKRWALLAQLDAHSKLFDNDADALGGAAMIGSLGLRAAVTDRFSLELGLFEDLKSRSTSDVVFQLQLDVTL